MRDLKLPSMKRWQVRFTAVPLKPLFDQDVILSFFFDNLDNFICFPAVVMRK